MASVPENRRTDIPRQLRTLTPVDVVGHWEPEQYIDVPVHVHFPDGTELVFPAGTMKVSAITAVRPVDVIEANGEPTATLTIRVVDEPDSIPSERTSEVLGSGPDG